MTGRKRSCRIDGGRKYTVGILVDGAAGDRMREGGPREWRVDVDVGVR